MLDIIEFLNGRLSLAYRIAAQRKDRQKVDEFCKLLEEYGAKFSLTTQQFLDHEQQEK